MKDDCADGAECARRDGELGAPMFVAAALAGGASVAAWRLAALDDAARAPLARGLLPDGMVSAVGPGAATAALA